jgi:hypothetical protein
MQPRVTLYNFTNTQYALKQGPGDFHVTSGHYRSGIIAMQMEWICSPAPGQAGI